MNHYEAWREALIAFYRAEGGWQPMTIAHLVRGGAMSDLDRRTIDGLIAATTAMKQAA